MRWKEFSEAIKRVYSVIKGTPAGADELWKHIRATYSQMRICVGVFAIAFPFVLWLFGRAFFNIELQASMSHYFHTEMRDVFVGGLAVIGTFLIFYRGYSLLENWLLNAAGAMVMLVASCPMKVECKITKEITVEVCSWMEKAGLIHKPDWLHGTSAIIAFVCIGLALVCCATDTLAKDMSPWKRRSLAGLYYLIGVAMFVLPAISWYWSIAVDGRHTTFGVEATALGVFGFYWLVKSYEIKGTQERAEKEGRPMVAA